MPWLLFLVVVLNQAPPRYLGGVEPQPLDKPGVADDSPSVHSCSLETLRSSVQCLFDGRPAAAVSEADRTRQARDNVSLALSLGEGLCRERASKLSGGEAEQAEHLRSCVVRTREASKSCALEGLEALLDASGSFSPKGKRCYHELAASIQLVGVPRVRPEAVRPEAVPAQHSHQNEVHAL